MIGASSMGPSFGGLANYLVGDESRVEWAETRNMNAGRDWGDGSGRDAFTAREVSAEMERRAVKGKTEEPMYHITIAFDPNDRPTDAELRGAVDRTLRDMGLDKHQALVVCHNDKDHEHVHVMVNRIGKDGRAWSPWQDQIKLRSSMEAQERELGVRWTGKNRELAHEVKARASEARERQADVTERMGRAQPPEIKRSDDRGFATEVRTKALVDLKESKTWAELDHRLEAHGLRIERRGQGAVVTDGEREAKLSTVSRSATRGRLETRLGPLREYERSRDHERGLAAPGREAPGRDRAPAERSDRERSPVERSREKAGPGRPRTTPRAPSAQIQARAAQRSPSSARQSAMQLRRSGQAALRAAREGGEREVNLGQVALRAGRGLAQAAAARTLRARAVHRDVRPGGRVDRLAVLVAEHRALGQVERYHREAAGARAMVRSVRSRAAQALDGQEKRARQTFERAMDRVYQDPYTAQKSFGQAVRSEGTEAASRTLAERPETYGALRETETARAFGLVKERTTAPARAAAPEAARAGAAHVTVSGRRARAVAAVESVEGTPVRSRPAARVRETPAVEAVVARVERTEGVLYEGAGRSRDRQRELERQIGRLSERIGRAPREVSRTDSRTKPQQETLAGRDRDARAVAPGGRRRDGARTAGGAAKGATLGKAPPERVQQALNARLGSVGIKTVARAAKTVERGIGRE